MMQTQEFSSKVTNLRKKNPDFKLSEKSAWEPEED